MLKIQGLCKVFNPNTINENKVFENFDIEINDGDFISIIGSNGAGKSTLLNLMAGIEKVSSGEILIKGKPIHKMSETKLAKFRQNHLGFVFQSYNLIGTMTALENVEFPLVFKRIPRKKRKKMAKEIKCFSTTRLTSRKM